MVFYMTSIVLSDSSLAASVHSLQHTRGRVEGKKLVFVYWLCQ